MLAKVQQLPGVCAGGIIITFTQPEMTMQAAHCFGIPGEHFHSDPRLRCNPRRFQELAELEEVAHRIVLGIRGLHSQHNVQTLLRIRQGVHCNNMHTSGDSKLCVCRTCSACGGMRMVTSFLAISQYVVVNEIVQAVIAIRPTGCTNNNRQPP